MLTGELAATAENKIELTFNKLTTLLKGREGINKPDPAVFATIGITGERAPYEFSGKWEQAVST